MQKDLFYIINSSISCVLIFFFCFSDLLYRHNVTFDNVTTEVEILDTSKCVVSDLYFIVKHLFLTRFIEEHRFGIDKKTDKKHNKMLLAKIPKRLILLDHKIKNF